MAAETRRDNSRDEVLVIAAILGDLRAFDELVMRYRAAAYRVARAVAGAELAEDAVQEALLLAFKALPSIEEPASFASWLCAITRHAALRMSQNARKEQARRVELDEAVLEYSDALARPFTLPESFETAEVRTAIEALDEQYSLILQLRFYDEMPLKRIASFLDLPLSTVKWRLHRAKQLMREQLEPARAGPAQLVEVTS
ncbi:MAG TPA: sigma-70 family RNA polymerase sigma factor [Blastocatellia bacterium]|nr:sigma-70 family RNA polymerase sigma factor [Blastocatellia bacterium]